MYSGNAVLLFERPLASMFAVQKLNGLKVFPFNGKGKSVIFMVLNSLSFYTNMTEADMCALIRDLDFESRGPSPRYHCHWFRRESLVLQAHDLNLNTSSSGYH